MEKNINPEINRLNMETSKQAADSLREWAGLDASKAPVASSFLNGSTSQMLKESNNNDDFSPKSKGNTSFSFGLTNTVSALKNSSLSELPAGKILLEKYDYLLLGKGISEAFLIEGLIEDLRSFSWENSVAPVLENLSNTYEKSRREVEVLKTYETIKSNPGRELFSDATSQMKNWLVSEERTSDTLIHGLKRFGFNPMVRNLVSFLSIYENQTAGKFSVGYDNDVCEVTNIYSPVHVNENESIFYSSGKFFRLEGETNSIFECEMDDVPSELADKAQILADRDIKIGNNKISLNLGNNRIEIVFENESKNIYFDGKQINEQDLPAVVSVSTNNLLEGSNRSISKAVFVSRVSEELVDLDFGKKIKSKIYEGVEANIFKIEGKIYVQTVNPAMRLNKMYEANATQAINIIQDFLKYDISESLTEFLEGEKAFLSIMKNDKKEIVKNIEILENELRKIDQAKEQNPLIANSGELVSLQEGIENEIESLKDRWNQINVEISRFENKAKEIDSVNEDMGYPIDTEVRVKRNGVKGKVIGVDGSSKTYTVLFKEGKTGEYFFSDVEDLTDEVDSYDIKSPELDLEFSDDLTNESEENFASAPDKSSSSHYDKVFMSMYKKHLSAAPNKKTGSSSKFIDDSKNSNLASVSNSGKKSPLTGNGVKSNSGMANSPKGSSGKGKNFIDNPSNADLADAPGSTAKTPGKFIQNLKDMNLSLKESQKNSHVERAPKAKSEKPKKFIEDEEDANLADAHGNSKKNGKKFVENMDRAGLSKAPASRSKKK